MKRIIWTLALLSLAVSTQAQNCNRESLKGVIDNYFKAVETHNLSSLPTAPNLRITENGKDMKPGEGLLLSGGKVQLRRDVIDTERCREYMNDVVNKYFSAFTNEKVQDGPYATPCHRWEGGLQTTARNGVCTPQGTGLVLNHTERRFPVTDLELGITAGFMNFGGGLRTFISSSSTPTGRSTGSTPFSAGACRALYGLQRNRPEGGRFLAIAWLVDLVQRFFNAF